MYEEKNCDNCNKNNNGGQGTLYGLIILVLVCVAGYLYAQNLHLQKEIDHYKYYFDDSYNDSDDDISSRQYSDDYSAEKDSITKIDKSSSGQCDNYEKFIEQSQ